MIEIEVNKINLEKFLSNIRSEDESELVFSLGKEYKDKFINICLKYKNSTYFLADENQVPLAIGGYVKKKNNSALVWLLAANDFKFYKKQIFSYIKQKIDLFKIENDFLFNYIFKSNFKALKWLKKMGFKTIPQENENYILFYFLKGENFDIRYFAC